MDLTPEAAAWLNELAARRGASPEAVLAELVEAEVARQAAPEPSGLDDREGTGEGRALVAGAWRVVLAPQAAREFDRFPPGLQREVLAAAARLAGAPLQGKGSGNRRRSGFAFGGTQWRVIYTLEEVARTVRILLVTTRENAVY